MADARLTGIPFHGIRRSLAAILVTDGCNVRAVSEWAGHSIAFTLTRYGGFLDGACCQG